MPAPTTPAEWRRRKIEGWTSSLARLVSGGTLFLVLTGLSVLLLPVSVFNQHAVIVHTVLGLIWLVPFVVYTVRHVAAYWDYPLTQSKFTGWVSGGMALVCVASGVVLTWDGVFGTYRVPLWRMVHIVSTIGLVIFLVPHLVSVLLTESRRKLEDPESARLVQRAGAHGKIALAWSIGGMALTGAMCALFPPVSFENAFPEGYELTEGGPFAPSLARTATGGAFASASLAGSAGCATSGCHTEIYREWQPSAHRYSAMDAGFQVIQGVMAEQNGPTSTRYCGGCHDPISLFAGEKRIGVTALTANDGFHEGISCLACHAIQQTDVKGNANYVIAQPPRYVFEMQEGELPKLLSDFLIRTYPDMHVETLSRRMFKTPEFCAACHKQFIDEEVNEVGWVQLQNQYDNWKASRWHDASDPQRTIECRECHMPLVDSYDPASGDDADFNRSADDGKHRSHRFLGANQYLPTLLGLEGGEEHVALIEQWLKGEYEIPEIADRWRPGPAVPIELAAPAEVRPGDALALRVRITNNKVGHDFPTGPLDIIQAWVEVQVEDEQGNVVYHTGAVDDEHVIDTGTYMFKAEPVDRYGNLIDRHNLWEMVGVRFKRSLFPGAQEVATFEFPCPGTGTEKVQDLPRVDLVELSVPEGASGTLTARAWLKYRKFDQFLLDFAFGKEAGLTAPITVVSTDEATIRVVP